MTCCPLLRNKWVKGLLWQRGTVWSTLPGRVEHWSFSICWLLALAFCIVCVGGAAFLWLSGCSLSLSLSLPRSQRVSPPLSFSRSWIFRSPVCYRQRSRAPGCCLRSVEQTFWEIGCRLHTILSVHLFGVSSDFIPGYFSKMTEEMRVRHVKLVGLWNPSLRAESCLSGSLAGCVGFRCGAALTHAGVTGTGSGVILFPAIHWDRLDLLSLWFTLKGIYSNDV